MGGGNAQFTRNPFEAYFPKQYPGSVRCFGLPEAESEVGDSAGGRQASLKAQSPVAVEPGGSLGWLRWRVTSAAPAELTRAAIRLSNAPTYPGTSPRRAPTGSWMIA